MRSPSFPRPPPPPRLYRETCRRLPPATAAPVLWRLGPAQSLTPRSARGPRDVRVRRAPVLVQWPGGLASVGRLSLRPPGGRDGPGDGLVEGRAPSLDPRMRFASGPSPRVEGGGVGFGPGELRDRRSRPLRPHLLAPVVVLVTHDVGPAP